MFPLFGPAAFGDTFGAYRADVAGKWHHGEDLVAPAGTPVLAVADGTLFSVGWNDIGGWRLWLRDGAGNEFYYAHLSAYSPLAVAGKSVKAGDVLGFVGSSGDADGGVSTATHYWMNSLQGVSDRENYFVTINRPEAIAPEKVVRRIAYEHPLFSLGAVRAQADIPALNASAAHSTRTYFAGAWQRYGFHEDGLLSAARLSEQLLGRDPWIAPRG